MFIKKLMVFTKTNPIKGICYNYVIFDVSYMCLIRNLPFQCIYNILVLLDIAESSYVRVIKMQIPIKQTDPIQVLNTTQPKPT